MNDIKISDITSEKLRESPIPDKYFSYATVYFKDDEKMYKASCFNLRWGSVIKLGCNDSVEYTAERLSNLVGGRYERTENQTALIYKENVFFKKDNLADLIDILSGNFSDVNTELHYSKEALDPKYTKIVLF